MDGYDLDKYLLPIWAGNNINHPNDFFARAYAHVILKTLVGKNA